jgi:hypothetical protein
MYKNFNKFIVRYPALGDLVYKLSEIQSYQDILDFWNSNPFFQQALFIASPNFHKTIKEIEVKKIKITDASVKEKKALLALYRYIVRITTRCTPFGLFSSISVCDSSINEDSGVKIEKLKNNVSITLDVTFANKIIDYLYTNYGNCPWYKYKINRSIYEIGGEFRYYEDYFDKDTIKVQISSIPKDKDINQIFSFLIEKNEFTFQEIANVVKNLEIDEETGKDFISELYNNKIIYSYYGINLIGEDTIILNDLLTNSDVSSKDRDFFYRLYSITRIADISLINFDYLLETYEKSPFHKGGNSFDTIFHFDLYNFKELNINTETKKDIIIDDTAILKFLALATKEKHERLRKCP